MFAFPPILALFLIILIDIIGANLTIIKSWKNPETENWICWAMCGVGGLFGILSVGSLNFVLLSYPIYICLMNSILAIIVISRKRYLAISPTYGQIINIEGFDFNCVSMGNPHTVALVEDLEKIDLKTIGPKIENNENFPNKINVEFVQKIMDNYFKVKVWERGCGATLACGTGACAVFSILNKLSARTFLAEKEITLEFPGGKLYLSTNEQDHVILRGPATFVFEGRI